MDGEVRNVFAIQICTGSEQMLSQFMKVLIPELPQADIFIIKRKLLYNNKRKSKVPWEENLFKGYIFVACDNIESLFFKLKGVPQATVLLHDGEYNFVTLSYDEQAVIRDLCAAGVMIKSRQPDCPTVYLFDISEIEIIPKIEADQKRDILVSYQDTKVIRILSGPLLNCADRIVRWDFHNRRVDIRVRAFNQDRLHLGFIIKDKDILGLPDEDEKTRT